MVKDKLGKLLHAGDKVVVVTPIKIKLDGLLLDVSGGVLKIEKIKKINSSSVYGYGTDYTIVTLSGDFDPQEVIKIGD